MATTIGNGNDRAVTRNTIQRALVLESVRSLRNHPTSADVYESVREHHPSISRATVYRNLGVLASRGEVLRVEVPNGADRYDFRTAPHCHAVCRMCGGVFDIEVSQVDLMSQVSDAHGFSIERHAIIFEGVCAQCRHDGRACAEGH
ncbi:transcriptional repressor [Gordonibacter sp. An230]|uniref:Fur family transcriptional regulator n=1 Tax=Gordonibacter sp. An230 TaxID=1965592 RepID=UPI000B376605|nr:transcriptional repressor [Gordonibacter sp. An230]OUO89016.1 transcriptional repressor [Gordonibacter sp. An230]